MNRPLARDYSVVWHNTDNHFYVEGCGLARMGPGEWLAAVPAIPRFADPLFSERASLCRVHILHSLDGGAAWEKIAELPHYSAVPFVRGGAVYLFANNGGTKFRNDDLLLRRSGDRGRSWTEPVTLLKGHFWNCHTAMAVKEDRLYWAFDDLSPGKLRGPRVIAGNLSEDLMEPGSWMVSDVVKFSGVPASLTHPVMGGGNSPGRWLEPNVINVNGNIRVLACVKPGKQSTTGVCAVFDVSDDGKNIRLSFTQFHPMPGAHLKFFTAWDDVSGMFWAAGNLAADGQDMFMFRDPAETSCGTRWSAGGNDRRFLMLMYGLDGLNWFPAGCIARADRLSRSFMYPAVAVDGDDLGVISRTSVHSLCRHDADYATFHRVKNFRGLAMKLTQDI